MHGYQAAACLPGTLATGPGVMSDVLFSDSFWVGFSSKHLRDCFTHATHAYSQRIPIRCRPQAPTSIAPQTPQKHLAHRGARVRTCVHRSECGWGLVRKLAPQAAALIKSCGALRAVNCARSTRSTGGQQILAWRPASRQRRRSQMRTFRSTQRMAGGPEDATMATRLAVPHA